MRPIRSGGVRGMQALEEAVGGDAEVGEVLGRKPDGRARGCPTAAACGRSSSSPSVSGDATAHSFSHRPECSQPPSRDRAGTPAPRIVQARPPTRCAPPSTTVGILRRPAMSRRAPPPHAGRAGSRSRNDVDLIRFPFAVPFCIPALVMPCVQARPRFPRARAIVIPASQQYDIVPRGCLGGRWHDRMGARIARRFGEIGRSPACRTHYRASERICHRVPAPASRLATRPFRTSWRADRPRAARGHLRGQRLRQGHGRRALRGAISSGPHVWRRRLRRQASAVSRSCPESR